MTTLIDGYCTPGTERDTRLPVDELMGAMDQAGIERAVIAPQDREIAVDYEAGNRRIGAMAGKHPDRLIPACTASPWRGEQGAEIVGHAVDQGSRMLVLAPALQGFLLSDEQLIEPLMDEAVKRSLPVYIHTGPHAAGSPAQVALLADRFVEVRFILGHCGSTDHAYDMRPVMELAPANLWYELSLVRPWALLNYGPWAGNDRLIFGSSAPRNPPGFELTHFDAHWPIADHPETYGENLHRLLSEVKP